MTKYYSLPIVILLIAFPKCISSPPVPIGKNLNLPAALLLSGVPIAASSQIAGNYGVATNALIAGLCSGAASIIGSIIGGAKGIQKSIDESQQENPQSGESNVDKLKNNTSNQALSEGYVWAKNGLVVGSTIGFGTVATGAVLKKVFYD